MLRAVITATDWESVLGCRRLVARQDILAGGSSVTVLILHPPAGSRIVTLLSDRGERYLDTATPKAGRPRIVDINYVY